MSAVASMFIGKSPAKAGPAWITVKEASERSGIDESHLRRLCPGFAARGLAGMKKPTQGGKSAWHISPSADPRFAAVQFPEQMEFDARQLTEQQRVELFARKRILDDWMKARGAATMGFTEAQITEQFLSHLDAERGRKLSRRTLFRWYSSFRAQGLAGLTDGRFGSAENRTDGTDESGKIQFLEYLKTLWLTTNKTSITSCHFAAMLKAQEMGWATIGLRASGLHLQKIPRAVVIKHREGSDAFVARCEPSLERDYSTLHTNETWVGDHHQCDVIVTTIGPDGRQKLVRPFLTAWMDMRSRKIVGWCLYAHDPNSNSILSALKSGIISHGAPELLYIDNGKDFSSRIFHGSTKWERRKGKIELNKTRFEGVLNHLQIKSRFCWAYHGQSKPIERFFGTLEEQFGRTWPTYRGNCPANRPEESERRLAAGEAPTLAEFTTQFSSWLDRCYHSTPHEGDGMNGRSPASVFDQEWQGFSKRTASADLLDLLLTRQTRSVRVGKNGVNCNGMSYGQFEPALIPMLGKQVYLRIDETVNSVQVWSEDDKLICIAPANRRLPANATHEEMQAAVAQKRGHKKLLKQFYERRPRLTEDLPDLMIRARAAALAASNSQPATDPGPAGPGGIRPIRSDLEDQLPALKNAFDFTEQRATGTDDVQGFDWAEHGAFAYHPEDDQ